MTTYRYPTGARGCVDGEFVSQFLELSERKRHEVMEVYRRVAGAGGLSTGARDVGADDLCRVIESLNERCG